MTPAPVRGDVDLRVLDPGPLTTVQDEGRPGWAYLGVTRSGFLDRASARWANRLVGNPEGAALLETTGGGVTLQVCTPQVVAVTGAPARVDVDGRLVGTDEAVALGPGAFLRVGPALGGVRSYVAFSGGLAVTPVLGSRASDLLGAIGPAPLQPGDELCTGRPAHVGPAAPPTFGVLPRDVFGARPVPEVWELRIVPGPRFDWLQHPDRLDGLECLVGAASNRVGLRLEAVGGPVARRGGELLSEPMVLGAVQLPPSGEPVVFLADHPTTGGYPVVAVVLDDDLDLCARMRPGERVRLRLLPR